MGGKEVEMNEEEAKILFGRRIKQLRTCLNLTQFTLGEYADINQRQVTLIETGKSFPSLKTLIKFAEIFHCSLQDLFTFDNLQDRKLLETELEGIIKLSSNDKVKVLYTVAKQLV